MRKQPEHDDHYEFEGEGTFAKILADVTHPAMGRTRSTPREGGRSGPSHQLMARRVRLEFQRPDPSAPRISTAVWRNRRRKISCRLSFAFVIGPQPPVVWSSTSRWRNALLQEKARRTTRARAREKPAAAVAGRGPLQRKVIYLQVVRVGLARGGRRYRAAWRGDKPVGKVERDRDVAAGWSDSGRPLGTNQQELKRARHGRAALSRGSPRDLATPVRLLDLKETTPASDKVGHRGRRPGNVAFRPSTRNEDGAGDEHKREDGERTTNGRVSHGGDLGRHAAGKASAMCDALVLRSASRVAHPQWIKFD